LSNNKTERVTFDFDREAKCPLQAILLNFLFEIGSGSRSRYAKTDVDDDPKVRGFQ
jgi:hypothetical protein